MFSPLKSITTKTKSKPIQLVDIMWKSYYTNNRSLPANKNCCILKNIKNYVIHLQPLKNKKKENPWFSCSKTQGHW